MLIVWHFLVSIAALHQAPQHGQPSSQVDPFQVALPGIIFPTVHRINFLGHQAVVGLLFSGGIDPCFNPTTFAHLQDCLRILTGFGEVIPLVLLHPELTWHIQTLPARTLHVLHNRIPGVSPQCMLQYEFHLIYPHALPSEQNDQGAMCSTCPANPSSQLSDGLIA